MIPGADVEMLQNLHTLHRPWKDEFFQLTTQRRAALFTAIKTSRNQLLDEVFARIHAVRPESQTILELQTRIYSYFDFSDWSLIDMIALAVCAPATVEQIARRVAPNALLYHCLRMLDDVLDGHQDYKGGAPTLLGELNSQPDMRPLAVAGNLLPLMILAVRSSAALPDEELRLYERTMIGMLHEAFAGNWRAEDGYRCIAEAKMGAYGMFLYRPVVLFFDTEIGKTLEPFLTRSFYISQLLNDLNDQPGDEARQQPNFWLSGRDPGVSNAEFMEEISALSRSCVEVAPLVRAYAHTRVTDLIGYCLQVTQASDQNRRNRPFKAS